MRGKLLTQFTTPLHRPKGNILSPGCQDNAPSVTSPFDTTPRKKYVTNLNQDLTLAARVAEVEKTQGPLSEAAKAEIAQSILAETLKSVKRSA